MTSKTGSVAGSEVSTGNEHVYAAAMLAMTNARGVCTAIEFPALKATRKEHLRPHFAEDLESALAAEVAANTMQWSHW